MKLVNELMDVTITIEDEKMPELLHNLMWKHHTDRYWKQNNLDVDAVAQTAKVWLMLADTSVVAAAFDAMPDAQIDGLLFYGIISVDRARQINPHLKNEKNRLEMSYAIQHSLRDICISYGRKLNQAIERSDTQHKKPRWGIAQLFATLTQSIH